ncbi:ATP-binding cassette domain-containing protein [bacterium]|nr:ATP-binding cassette domain-containing protein [bacterium]
MDVIIELANVSKSYNEIKAVENLSFKLKKGEILGFLGPNGAGKTTAMKMITGYMPPDTGTIKVKNEDILKDPVNARISIGYLPENNPLYLDMTVAEYLNFIAEMRGIENREKAIDSALTKCGIKNVSHRIINHLSKGYKQRVGLAQAIIHDPEILILDEPVNGLDPKQITEIRNLIKELGKEKTVILCSHILSEVEAVADRVLIINNGKIAADDTIENLRERSKGSNIFVLDIIDETADIAEKLNTLENVKKVEKVHSGLYRIFAAGNKETGHSIFVLAASNNWKVVQLYLEGNSLENMFLNLTEGGK